MLTKVIRATDTTAIPADTQASVIASRSLRCTRFVAARSASARAMPAWVHRSSNDLCRRGDGERLNIRLPMTLPNPAPRRRPTSRADITGAAW